MKRIVVSLTVILFAGCCLPEDRHSLKPLADAGRIFTYPEILSRARSQASLALEAFYVDGWMDLDQAAQALEQTARFLPKTSEQPEKLKEALVQESAKLQKDAVRLGEAARAKDVMLTNETLQRIHLQLRGLRPQD